MATGSYGVGFWIYSLEMPPDPTVVITSYDWELIREYLFSCSLLRTSLLKIVDFFNSLLVADWSTFRGYSAGTELLFSAYERTDCLRLGAESTGFKAPKRILLAVCSEQRVIMINSWGQTWGTRGLPSGLSTSRMFLRAKKIIPAAISLGFSYLKREFPFEMIKSEILRASMVI